MVVLLVSFEIREHRRNMRMIAHEMKMPEGFGWSSKSREKQKQSLLKYLSRWQHTSWPTTHHSFYYSFFRHVCKQQRLWSCKHDFPSPHLSLVPENRDASDRDSPIWDTASRDWPSLPSERQRHRWRHGHIQHNSELKVIAVSVVCSVSNNAYIHHILLRLIALV